MRKAETCMREMNGEAAVHLGPTDAAPIQPLFWSRTLRCEPHKHGSSFHSSTENSAGYLAHSNSKHQPHWRTYPREEREEMKMSNSRGEERRVVKMVSQSQGTAMKVF